MASRQSSVFSPLATGTLLDLADELAHRPTPASLRSAADRAYYAAYLTARDQLARKKYARFNPGGSAHVRVGQALRAIDIDTGNLLSELRFTRNTLTYDTGYVALEGNRTVEWMLDAGCCTYYHQIRGRPVNPALEFYMPTSAFPEATPALLNGDDSIQDSTRTAYAGRWS